jgi:hypothetical protein
VEGVIPEAVKTDCETGTKSISHGGIIALLVEAVKELSNKYDSLIKELNNAL